MQGPSPRGKKLLVLGAIVGAFALPQAAQAAPPASVFAGTVPCTVQGDGVDFCGSTAPARTTVPAFDGVPIDVNVALPDPAQFGSGPYPLMMMFHGYGGGKFNLATMHRFLDRGYATFTMTDRGFRESCGSPASKAAAGAACDNGYVRLIDNRYEVRDAQEFAGQLADENLIDPQKIGAIGGSYGGGMSMALGALKNRKVLPDYSVVPWTSPGGKAMQIAAAAPNIPWTDLAYSLTPNGSTLDYVDDAPYRGRVGVEKQSFVTGLYLSGLGAPGFYAPAGFDPTADLVGWQTKLEMGEPYGAEAQAIIDEITLHHSSYYIDHTIAPAPMLMSSGFTDDLFPADETIRYYNRTRGQYPDADLALLFGDFGHMRGQNKADVTTALQNAENAWMDYFVKGVGTKPTEGVTAYTETCPSTAASGGPYNASTWATMAPGEIRFDDASSKTIAPNSTTNGAFDPVSGGGACGTKPADDTAGAAVYKLDAAPAGGYTMMGAATVLADFTLPGDTSQVAARLLDVAPDNTETLVDRGLWRPATGGPTQQVFQLHPNGWNFAEGHVPKLELIASDSGSGALSSYGRASNNQQPVTVSNLELRLPVLEKPGSFNGLVGTPAQKFLPPGYKLATEFAALSSPHPTLSKSKLEVKGSKLIGKIDCPAEFAACDDLEAIASGKLSGHKKAVKVAKGKLSKVAGGKSKTLKLKLTSKGKKYFRDNSKLKLTVEISSAEVAEPTTEKAKAVAKGK
ncbi:MAG: type transport system ATP-binding protein [Solirubrobacterales bacterium]|nr:type transport system ATP-binding protein [Solirubrobacterales bacterium]